MLRRFSFRLASAAIVTLVTGSLIANSRDVAAEDCCGKSPVQAPTQTPKAAPTAIVRTTWKCRKVEIRMSNGISQYGGNVCTDGLLSGAFGQQDRSGLALLTTGTCGTSSSFCYGPFRVTATDTDPTPTPAPDPTTTTVQVNPQVFAVGAPLRPKLLDGIAELSVKIPGLFESKLVRQELVEYPVGAGSGVKTIRVQLFAIDYALVLDPKTGKVDKGTYFVGREVAIDESRVTAKVTARAIDRHAHQVTIDGEQQPFLVINHHSSPPETSFIRPDDGGDSQTYATDCHSRLPRLRNLIRGCRR